MERRARDPPARAHAADGFTARHRYPPVRIGGAVSAAAAGGDGGPAADRLALAALAGLGAAALALVLPRRRRPAANGG